jgi:hypothetical protein
MEQLNPLLEQAINEWKSIHSSDLPGNSSELREIFEAFYLKYPVDVMEQLESAIIELSRNDGRK